jgi:malate dehydrogenase (oxaloacetate-decarboxylating)
LQNANRRGFDLIDQPLYNNGSGFLEDERAVSHLNALFRPAVETIEIQAQRVHAAYKQKDSDIEPHIFLRALQDSNETLFYRVIVDHVSEMLPMVYTPVVGLVCQTFSETYRRPRGLFLSYPR